MPELPSSGTTLALALFKMKEEGKWGETLKKWLLEESKLDLISFRPFVPWELRMNPSKYELTPQEKSSLFISTLQAFLENDPDEAIQILLQLLESSPQKNRYVLAGILLRATQ